MMMQLDHIEHADVMDYLRGLPDQCVNLVVTSPPYYSLRDYGVDGQIGLEPTPAAYITALVDIFREVRRVLRADGNCYVNLGDSYSSSGGPEPAQTKWAVDGASATQNGGKSRQQADSLPPKSLMLIPHRFAIAMQDDGWLLREDLVWQKPNPMPESVRDRCTRSHEYIFHFTKQARYWYDKDAVSEPVSESSLQRWGNDVVERKNPSPQGMKVSAVKGESTFGVNGIRNRRSVWTINPASYKGAHFATFPEDIPEICIKAACPEWCCDKCGAPYEAQVETAGEWRAQHDREQKHDGTVYRRNPAAGIAGPNTNRTTTHHGYAPSCSCNAGKRAGVVLDPFMGAGTTALVAKRLNRRYLGCDLNAEYVRLARERIDGPLFAAPVEKAVIVPPAIPSGPEMIPMFEEAQS